MIVRSAVVATAFLGACSFGPPPFEGEGHGIVTVDQDVPEDARTWSAPEWSVGDRFEFERGGMVRIAVRVTAAESGGYVLVDERTGVELRLDEQLGELGEHVPADDSRDRVRDPVDARLTWPLWVGKRWVCHYVQRDASGAGFPILASYSCDALEEIETPAGTFEALRIWREARPAVEGEFLEACEVMWYAPEVGWFIRRLSDSTLTELTDYQRTRPPAAGAAEDS